MILYYNNQCFTAKLNEKKYSIFNYGYKSL